MHERVALPRAWGATFYPLTQITALAIQERAG
ncbi:hypothetical protein Pvag_pPag30033 (plasmid) [Pantoea vagans C9-1]|nr:hypothetical protein Pvag_pPag30033 [Pantoea vagans C9-1]